MPRDKDFRGNTGGDVPAKEKSPDDLESAWEGEAREERARNNDLRRGESEKGKRPVSDQTRTHRGESPDPTHKPGSTQ